MKVRITRIFTVLRPASVVIDYLKDFGHAVHWDPGTQSCRRVDSGPVRVGSVWHNVSLFIGRRVELTYRLTVLEPGRRRGRGGARLRRAGPVRSRLPGRFPMWPR